MHTQEPCQTSKTKCLTKKVNGFQPLSIYAKNSILDIWQGSDYVSGLLKLNCHGSKIHGYTRMFIYALLIILFTPKLSPVLISYMEV